jgi:exodeoxyribonuclease VII large subunit
MEPLSLYELNGIVRSTLELTLDENYWVVAELSEVRVAGNGHCYVEFVEKEERSGAMVAKARGNIWKNTYNLLAPYFEQETGQRFAAGLKVLVNVSVGFHELYGYSLTVLDIDPTYTLGAAVQRRKEILALLEADGVLTLNKELTLPRPLLRIAVVSSASAAGYGDFCDQIKQSGLPFKLKLFPATMQGEGVESGVIAVLEKIAAEDCLWDAVAIIRGGGAVSDLAGFETYLLAAHVAQFPLPVLTGIGHERDDTVVDLVAHTRLKTPTAVAAFLVERQREEINSLADLEHRLQQTVVGKVEQNRLLLQSLQLRVQAAAASYGRKEEQRLLQMGAALERNALQALQQQKNYLKNLSQSLQQTPLRQIDNEQRRLDYIQKLLHMSSLDRILQMGFSLTLSEGKAVRSAAQLVPGMLLTTHFAEGKMESRVETVDVDETE